MVARSTMKDEYIMITLGVAEIIWLMALLTELRLNREAVMKLWCDS
jgi:hypothetical protein